MRDGGGRCEVKVISAQEVKEVTDGGIQGVIPVIMGTPGVDDSMPWIRGGKCE